MIPLPIDAVIPEVLAAARTGTFVLVAPPGAGKTTRVPRALVDEVPGSVIVVEPRRVAARAAATRIAQERGQRIGDEVGWHVRFDRRGGARTRLWVVTEGILLRRLQADPFLDGVSAVILDEFHGRSLQADLALALLWEVHTTVRTDLRIGVMSATLDADPVAAFLGGAPIVRSAGRSFPVAISHRPSRGEDPDDAVASAVREVWASEEGDVLVFLPGVREIRRVTDRLAGSGAPVVPLYGSLPPEAQDRALLPGRSRRVVLATNLAETSVTVPGVRVVVDSGRVRRPRFDTASGLDRLVTESVSLASADQRAGRAGRTAPGTAIRLWSHRAHRALDPFDPPELFRVDLSGAVLQILSWGADPHTFRWLDPPPPHALDAALGLLADLGAVEGGTPTPRGLSLAELPLHPRLGTLLLAGAELGQGPGAALAAALLSEGIRVDGRDAVSDSDLTDAMARVRQQGIPQGIRRVARDLEGRLAPGSARGVPEEEALGRAVLAGWPDRVAQRRGDSDRARLVGGRGVVLDGRSRVLHAPLFVAVDVEDATPEGRVRLASAVDRGWLSTITETALAFDPDSGSVRARRQICYRDLVLSAQPVAPDPIDGARILAEAAAGILDQAVPDDEDFAQLRLRLAFAARRDPDLPAADDALWSSLLPALAVGRRSLADLRRADWGAALRDHIGWGVFRRLDTLAPVRVTVPSGSSVRLAYRREGAPVLAVRMQELFGLTETPRVGGSPVLLHLLAPNGRPQQITDDLAGFWERTWPDVRKELRARYPKHDWPEDPAHATPRRRPPRQRR